MSENSSTRQDDIEIETEGLDDDVDESVVQDRKPRAPSITHLGRYRLVREIASGGMATVNLAVAEGLEKLVALKIIHPHLAQEDNFVRMFLDEARLASAISHRNVCSVFDFGDADGRYYIAMDYLAGQSLRDVLRRLRKSDVQIEPRRLAVYVAYMLAEACEGLHAAHELQGADGQPLNVVHRDVSPHNLFVTYDGNVSVVDFGIARASDRIQNTATGVLKGKFSYMAPEQMRQLEIDRRADVWALGVVLWESLTLQRLFVRSSQADTVMSVMMDKVRPPSELRPDLPKELDLIVLKAIARNPANRFPTAREMGRELMRFCRESGVLVGPLEIEQLMERLFEKEIADSKLLLQGAKRSGKDSSVWMELTPSGYTKLPTGSSSSALGTQSSARALAKSSQTAPAAQARGTAHPDDDPRGSRTKRGAVWLGVALSACALLGTGVWLGRKDERAGAIAAAVPERTGPAPVGAMVPSQPAPPVTPPAVGEPSSAPIETSKLTPAPSRAAPPGRPEPRREVRGRATPGKAQATHNQTAHAPAGARDPESTAAPPARADAAEESAERSAEAPEPAAPAPEARPEPSAPDAPAAASAQQAGTERVEPVTPPSSPARPTQSSPEKLAAQTEVTQLDVEGSLGSSIVTRMLARATGPLKSCYAQSAQRAGKNDFGALPIRLTIDESGAVRQVSSGKHALAELPTCATAALKRMRADRVPDVGSVQVSFVLTFRP